MITETGVKSFSRHLDDMLNQVRNSNDSIVIKKDGAPIAALVGTRMFARIQRMQDRFDVLSQRIARGFEDAPMLEGTSEIDAAVKAARRSG